MVEWMSLSLVAKEMKYDKDILKTLCQQSKIQARKKGRGWQIEIQSLQNYEKKNLKDEIGYQKKEPVNKKILKRRIQY